MYVCMCRCVSLSEFVVGCVWKEKSASTHPHLTTKTPRNALNNPPQQDQYKIRRAFISEPGKSLIVADYGQLELRLLAHITKCQSMINVRAGVRALACVFGFGVVYGVGEEKRRLGLAYSLSLNSSPTRNINSTNYPKPPPQNQKTKQQAFKEGGCFHSRTAVGMFDYIREAVDRGDVRGFGWLVYIYIMYLDV